MNWEQIISDINKITQEYDKGEYFEAGKYTANILTVSVAKIDKDWSKVDQTLFWKWKNII